MATAQRRAALGTGVLALAVPLGVAAVAVLGLAGMAPPAAGAELGILAGGLDQLARVVSLASLGLGVVPVLRAGQQRADRSAA